MSVLTPAASGTEWDTLDLLLLDEEWIAQEFAAIMTASGVVDQVVAVMSSASRGCATRDEGELADSSSATNAPKTSIPSRVRSPPIR